MALLPGLDPLAESGESGSGFDCLQDEQELASFRFYAAFKYNLMAQGWTANGKLHDGHIHA